MSSSCILVEINNSHMATKDALLSIALDLFRLIESESGNGCAWNSNGLYISYDMDSFHSSSSHSSSSHHSIPSIQPPPFNQTPERPT